MRTLPVRPKSVKPKAAPDAASDHPSEALDPDAGPDTPWRTVAEREEYDRRVRAEYANTIADEVSAIVNRICVMVRVHREGGFTLDDLERCLLHDEIVINGLADEIVKLGEVRQ